MWGHKMTLNKFKDWNHVKHFFWPHSMRLELQEKKWKKHKHMETKQHATRQLMGQWRNQTGNQKISEDK